MVYNIHVFSVVVSCKCGYILVFVDNFSGNIYNRKDKPLKTLFGFLDVNEKAYIELNKATVLKSSSMYEIFKKRTQLFRYHSFDDK